GTSSQTAAPVERVPRPLAVGLGEKGRRGAASSLPERHAVVLAFTPGIAIGCAPVVAGSPLKESEWRTRKRRIDPKLDAAGWRLPPDGATPLRDPYRSEEEETDNGPADYALWFDHHVVGIVEGKRPAAGAQNIVTQAERYARGLRASPYNFDGIRAPFLYSTNGEIIWFRDVRHPLNLSRPVAAFHTPAGLREMLAKDFGGACERLLQMPHEHPLLRPYQRDANAAVDKAIAERKRHMLVAMATGTGKTFTFVN